MIGRKSTKRLAELADTRFARRSGHGGAWWVPADPVYDFLYEHDFDAAFCNAAKGAASGGQRSFVEFILKLHTGESFAKIGSQLPQLSAETLCQDYLRRLSQCLLADTELLTKSQGPEAQRLAAALKVPKRDELLKRALELDGYVYSDGRLRHLESAVVDMEKQHNVLRDMTRQLGFQKVDVLEQCLDRSEEHYTNGNWEDCIGNSRKFLEGCLQEAAATFSTKKLGTPLGKEIYDWPAKVRDFFKTHGLLSEKEHRTIVETYGLLSNVGNHPNMAANDQARLLRQVALLYSEFVMLRVKGAIRS